MPRTDRTDQICQDCWNRAINAYGTGQIFLKRSLKYTRLLQALSFFGIVVPLLIGGIVIGFGAEFSHIKLLLGIAAVAGIAQLIFSAWSIVFSWADCLQYSLESASENFDLSLKYKDIGQQAANPPEDIEIRVASLNARDDSRQSADAKRGVTPKELRYGHRAGLRQFLRSCSECKQIPRSMEATSCQTCGSF